jgi:predicted DNA-binding transcriptional regulator AlpA
MHKISSRPRTVAWANIHVLSWMRERLATSGGDPDSIPQEPFAYWRLPEVQRRVGVKHSTIYRWIQAGTFPRPIPLGGPPPSSLAVCATRRSAAMSGHVTRSQILRRLTGSRCRCPTCDEYFNSTSAFDRHRAGPWRDQGMHRRCLSADEMTARGWRLNAKGFWIERQRPVAGLDRARISGDQVAPAVRGRPPSSRDFAHSVDEEATCSPNVLP